MQNFNLQLIKSMSRYDAMTYLNKYFIPLTDGNHAMYEDGKYQIKDESVIKSTYFKRMSKELNDYYFKETTDIKRITYELNKPTFYDDYINLCPQIKSKNDTPFASHGQEAQEGVHTILNYIKEVLASNNEDGYQYLLKWFSNMMKGGKNDCCLYLKGIQGIGKSTISEFLKDYVIGTDLLLETGSEPLKSRFNSILGGKLLVVFEELESFSTNEWSAVSSVLKRYITSTTYTLEVKNMTPYQANNINNYILNSNNDSIKDDDGRRYFILDVSTKYFQDKQYFGNLRSKAFNDAVGQAFYAYMMEVDTTGFIPQKYPMTQSKMNSHAKRLDKVYDYIKQIYVLPKMNMNITPKELYSNYKLYSENNQQKAVDKTTFTEKLKSVGMEYRKTKGNHYYIFDANELLEIANRHKWIHELDEDEMPTDNSAIHTVDEMYAVMLQEKDDEIAKLRQRIAELEAPQSEDLIDTL
jgi:hypothetical protein